LGGRGSRTDSILLVFASGVKEEEKLVKIIHTMREAMSAKKEPGAGRRLIGTKGRAK